MPLYALHMAAFLFRMPVNYLLRKRLLMSTISSLTSFDVFPSLAIGVTRLTGEDNKKFLQGQLTCDLDLLSPDKSA